MRTAELAAAERERVARLAAPFTEGCQVTFTQSYGGTPGQPEHRTMRGRITRIWDAGRDRIMARIAVTSPAAGLARYVERRVRDLALTVPAPGQSADVLYRQGQQVEYWSCTDAERRWLPGVYHGDGVTLGTVRVLPAAGRLIEISAAQVRPAVGAEAASRPATSL